MRVQTICLIYTVLLLSTAGLSIPMFQDTVPSPQSDPGVSEAIEPISEVPVQVELSPEEMMANGKQAFVERRFDDCISILNPLFIAKDAAAMILTADAWYAKDSEEAIAAAQSIYFRIIYELYDAPFRDHCYFRVAEIYREQANPFEAKLYYQQTVKKFTDSNYLDEAALILFKLAESKKHIKDMKKWATYIQEHVTEREALDYITYITVIYRKTRDWDPDEVLSVFKKNHSRIIRSPEVLLAYAERLKQLSLNEEAKQAYLDLTNFHPDRKGKLLSLLEIANFEHIQGHSGAALFLYKSIIDSGDDRVAEARAMIQVADMIAQAKIDSFTTMGKKWTYSDLLTAIRFSALKPGERAPFVYRQALLQAISDPPSKALLTLRQLTGEYKEGPYSSLYRDTYKELLHNTVSNFYREKRYWDLDRVYQTHRFFLEHSTETQYPHMMAKAFLEMGLTAPAREVFEALWREKERVEGFELAYEEPFTDYFLLLNDLRLDDFLEPRLKKYTTYYQNEGRYYDRFLLALTAYEARTLEAKEVIKRGRALPLFLNNKYDSKRIQLLSIAAQEAQDWGYAQELFQKALKWKELKDINPYLMRAARIYDADFQFRTGNYFQAKKKYLELRVDQSMLEEERIWADLQLARLFEMQGELNKSLELYGQVALNSIPETQGYANFARRRLKAQSYEIELDAIPKGVLLGKN